MKLRRILVAIKPWERGLPLAARQARVLAEAADAEIELVSSVFDASVGAGYERGELPARRARDRTIAAAHAALERLAGSTRDWGANVTTQIVWGVPPYASILTVAEEWQADLLVVGAHEQATRQPRLTDTDWQLMRYTRCPLLLVKRAFFEGYRTVMAAVDPLRAHDEPEGLDHAVLDAARSFARSFGAAFRVAYAYAGPRAFELASAVEVAPGVFYGSENVESLHRRAVNELAAPFGVPPADIDLYEGRPPQAIVDVAAARRADLVVVGAVQRTGLAAVAHENTAELVAGEVACDVLIVPPPREPRTVAARRSEVRGEQPGEPIDRLGRNGPPVDVR